MLASAPGIPIKYYSIVFWILKYIIYFSLQLGSESILCMYTGVSWGGMRLWKKQVESTRASLTPVKSYCPDTLVGSFIWIQFFWGHGRWGATHANKCARDSRCYFGQTENQDLLSHDKVVERPQNTTNTILLDVTWASALTCWITCTYFGAVWGLSTDSLPAWKQPSEKNNRDAGRELHVGECCWRFNTQTLNCKTMGSLQNRQNIIELSKSHVVHVTAGHIAWDRKIFDFSLWSSFHYYHESQHLYH